MMDRGELVEWIIQVLSWSHEWGTNFSGSIFNSLLGFGVLQAHVELQPHVLVVEIGDQQFQILTKDTEMMTEEKVR